MNRRCQRDARLRWCSLAVLLLTCLAYVSQCMAGEAEGASVYPPTEDELEPHLLNMAEGTDTCPLLSLTYLVNGALHTDTRVATLQCPLRGTSPLFTAAREEWERLAPLRARQKTDPFPIEARRFPNLYSDSAPLYFSLRAEMEAYHRVKRDVGMLPAAYEYTMQQLRVFTNETRNKQRSEEDLNASAGDIHGALGGDEEPEPLVFPPLDLAATGTINASCTSEADSSLQCHWARAVVQYREHANRTLSAMPWLSVRRSVLAEAKRWHTQRVLGGLVIRTLHLDAQTHAKDPDAVRSLLKFVQRMWYGAAARVEAETMSATPLLPEIGLESLIGPARPYHEADAKESPVSQKQTRAGGKEERNVMVNSSPLPNVPPVSSMGDAATVTRSLPLRTPFLHWPHRLVAPTAVVYYDFPDVAQCPSCGFYSAAFDLLPALFHRICTAGHHTIVGCSPLMLFIRVEETNPFSQVPRMELYTRPSAGSFFDMRDVLLYLMGLLKDKEGAQTVSSPEYDVHLDQHHTVPFSARVIMFSITESDAFHNLNPVDAFRPYTIALGNMDRQRDVPAVLADLIHRFLYHSVVQCHSCAREEWDSILGRKVRTDSAALPSTPAAESVPLRGEAETIHSSHPRSDETRGITNLDAQEEDNNHTDSATEQSDLSEAERFPSLAQTARWLVRKHFTELYGNFTRELDSAVGYLCTHHMTERRQLKVTTALGYAWATTPGWEMATLGAALVALVWQCSWSRKQNVRCW